MKWTIQAVLAAFATLMCFGFLGALIFVEVPENNKELLSSSFGTLIGGSIVLAFSYYFGDSNKVGKIKDGDEDEV